MVLNSPALDRLDLDAGVQTPHETPQIAVGSKRFGRAFDLAFAGLVVSLLSPALVVIAGVVKATSRGPVFYRQERAGIGGRPFRVFKFRSMEHENDDSAHRALCRSELERPTEFAPTTDGVFKLEEDPRVTRVSQFLRRWSIDELPQFFNVIRGDMAVVGPRPLPTWEVALIPACYQQRARVRPGLTGLWQVSGRNRLNTAQMLELDLEYVRRRSWRLDCSIIARTPVVLLRGDGAR